MQQPTRLISTPFAQEGDKTEIQNVTGEFDNSATYRHGFPLTMPQVMCWRIRLTVILLYQ